MCVLLFPGIIIYVDFCWWLKNVVVNSSCVLCLLFLLWFWIDMTYIIHHRFRWVSYPRMIGLIKVVKLPGSNSWLLQQSASSLIKVLMFLFLLIISLVVIFCWFTVDSQCCYCVVGVSVNCVLITVNNIRRNTIWCHNLLLLFSFTTIVSVPLVQLPLCLLLPSPCTFSNNVMTINVVVIIVIAINDALLRLLIAAEVKTQCLVHTDQWAVCDGIFNVLDILEFISTDWYIVFFVAFFNSSICFMMMISSFLWWQSSSPRRNMCSLLRNIHAIDLTQDTH